MGRHPLFVGIITILIGLSTSNSQAEEPTVASELERTASSTPQEKLDYAAKAAVEIGDAVKSIGKMLNAAQSLPNAQETQGCLNSILTSVKALLQVTQTSTTAMEQALKAGQAETADREFRKIAIAVQKTRESLAAAERCSGSLDAQGENRLSVEGEDIGSDGDTQPDDFGTVDIDIDPIDVSRFAGE